MLSRFMLYSGMAGLGLSRLPPFIKDPDQPAWVLLAASWIWVLHAALLPLQRNHFAGWSVSGAMPFLLVRQNAVSTGAAGLLTTSTELACALRPAPVKPRTISAAMLTTSTAQAPSVDRACTLRLTPSAALGGAVEASTTGSGRLLRLILPTCRSPAGDLAQIGIHRHFRPRTQPGPSSLHHEHPLRDHLPSASGRAIMIDPPVDQRRDSPSSPPAARR